MNKNQIKVAMAAALGVAALGFILNATRGNSISDGVRGGFNK